MDTSGSPNADNLASILEVAMTVREPRSAGQIAEATGLAEATVETYLTQLVEVDTLATLERGRKTCYYPDPVTQYFDQIRDLITNHENAELTAELDAIRAEIEEWKATYNVESADELRTTVGDELPAAERRQRREVAEDWEYFDRRVTLIEQAIQLYDSIETIKDFA